MSLYIILSIVLIFVSFFPLHDYIVINSLSLGPIIFGLVSILQGYIFKSYSNADKDELVRSSAVHSTRDIDYTAYRYSLRYQSVTKFAIIPVFILLVFYFAGWFKILLSFVIYALSYLASYVLARLKRKRD